MDLERLNFLHAAHVTAKSTGTFVELLFSKPGLILIVLLFFHLQHINKPEVRAAKDRELRQAKIELDAKQCFKNRVHEAMATDTPLAKNAKEICMQESIARQERYEARMKKELEFSREQKKRYAGVIEESQK